MDTLPEYNQKSNGLVGVRTNANQASGQSREKL